MYTMVETLRWPNEAEPDQRHQRLRENFRNDLSEFVTNEIEIK